MADDTRVVQTDTGPIQIGSQPGPGKRGPPLGSVSASGIQAHGPAGHAGLKGREA